MHFSQQRNRNNLRDRMAEEENDGDDDVLVSEDIMKDDETIIKVQVKQFKGSYYFDIREWKDKPSYEGPTKKGVNVPLERASGLLNVASEILKKAFEEMDQHVKEVQEEEMEKDLDRLKNKYGSHT